MRQGNSSRRSRGRGNGKRHPRSNQIDSHGPEVRVRGTAQQVFDKYLALARDATSTGDRIAAENMFQHAEHYSRVLSIAQENTDNRDNGKNRHDRSSNTQNDNSSKNQVELEPNEDKKPSDTVNDPKETEFDTKVAEDSTPVTNSSDNKKTKQNEPENDSTDTTSGINDEAKQATF